ADWLAPLPAQLLEPQFWIAAESQSQRATFNDIPRGGEQFFGSEPNLLQRWAGRLGLGFLPELTLQAVDAHWLDDLHALGGLQGVALARQ
ncbi:hypothetical protein ABTK96_19325, partial [Acinetobacter baumannii]